MLEQLCFGQILLTPIERNGGGVVINYNGNCDFCSTHKQGMKKEIEISDGKPVRGLLEYDCDVCGRKYATNFLFDGIRIKMGATVQLN